MQCLCVWCGVLHLFLRLHIQPRGAHYFADVLLNLDTSRAVWKRIPLRVSRLIRRGMLFSVFLSCKQIHWFGYDSMPSPSCKAFVEVRIMFQNLWFYNPSSSGQFLPRPLGINFPATTWWKPGLRPGNPAEFVKIAVVLICSTAAVLAWKRSYPL